MRYGDTPGDRFFLGLEQLEVCRELLRSGSPAKARMAVILLDGLLDALLYRRLEALYRASEDPMTRRDMDPYPKKVRREARLNFARRIELAQESTYYDELWGGSGAVVDEDDAAILLVGHSYRNNAYHRDTHNPAVIDLVGKTLFAAVARVFTRAQSASWGLSNSAERQAVLARLGVKDDGSLTYRDAAAQAAETLGAGLDVHVEALGDALAEDLGVRSDEAAELADYLPETANELDVSLARYEVWSKHAADDDLLELAARMEPFTRARREGLRSIPDDYVLEAKDATRAYIERMRELERTSETRVSLSLIDQARETADRLRAGSSVAAVMTDYHATDNDLSLLEEYLADAVAAYDTYINEEIDRHRGN